MNKSGICDDPYFNGPHHKGHMRCIRNKRYQEARVRQIKAEWKAVGAKAATAIIRKARK